MIDYKITTIHTQYIEKNNPSFLLGVDRVERSCTSKRGPPRTYLLRVTFRSLKFREFLVSVVDFRTGPTGRLGVMGDTEERTGWVFLFILESKIKFLLTQ